MLNIAKSYAKIWELEDKGKYVQGKIGTSRKNKQTDEWVSSNWFCRFVGQAAEPARTLKQGDRIIILNGVLESVYSKEKQRVYTTLTVFEFEAQQSGFTPVEDDDTLPF